MKKKRFVMVLLVLTLVVSGTFAGCGGGAAGPGNVDSGEVITWTVQGSGGAGTQYDRLYSRFCENVELMSGGRLVMDYYPVGTIVAFSEMPNAVIDGTVDAICNYSGMWSNLEYAAPLFCSTPGMFHDARDLYMWLYYGGGNELWQEMSNKYGCVSFPISLLDMEVFQWSNKKLQTMDDLKGAKMRMMPLMGEVMQANGMSVAFLAANELFASLERGVVDGIEYGNPALDVTEGFYEIAHYYVYPGIHQPSATQDIVINEEAWNLLSDDLKEVVQICAREAMLYNWGDSGFETVKALETFEENGNELVILDDEVVDTLMKWSNDYFKEKMKEDEFFAKVRQSQMDFGNWWFPYKEFIEMPYPTFE